MFKEQRLRFLVLVIELNKTRNPNEVVLTFSRQQARQAKKKSYIILVNVYGRLCVVGISNKKKLIFFIIMTLVKDQHKVERNKKKTNFEQC